MDSKALEVYLEVEEKWLEADREIYNYVAKFHEEWEGHPPTLQNLREKEWLLQTGIVFHSMKSYFLGTQICIVSLNEKRLINRIWFLRILYQRKIIKKVKRLRLDMEVSYQHWQILKEKYPLTRI